MKAIYRFRLPFLLAVALAISVPVRASPWSDARTPTPGPGRSIGLPFAGCLAGGEALPFQGPGFEVVHISRHRYFGNPKMIAFIEALGRRAKAHFLPPFYVGDISMPRGGPMPNGHASHETGLDVDVWFDLGSKPELKPAAREKVDLPSMLLPSGRAIDPRRFTRRQVELLRLAATDPRVDRIFVNPVIKRALCEGYAGAKAGNAGWLHRIRPWYGHEAHFHVRLKCPVGSASCIAQKPVPPGSGCDASLDWWFRKHAPSPPSPSQKPVLPVACRKLIHR